MAWIATKKGDPKGLTGMFYSGRQMRRKATGLPPASPLQYCNGLPIATRFALRASTEVQSEKLPWVEAIAAELSPAKAYPAKSVVLSQGTDESGVFSPQGAFRTSHRLVGWQGNICDEMPCKRRRQPSGSTDKGRRGLAGFLNLVHPVSQVNGSECAELEAVYHVLGHGQTRKAELCLKGFTNAQRPPDHPSHVR